MSHSARVTSQADAAQTARPGVIGTIALWLRRERQRAQDRAVLAQLSDWDLHDMGASRSVVEYELARPFWRG
jgi:uncharacterized protein YjiS (DUF1127 family)